ncbi:MAG: Cytosine deaminase and related metal-dependent hydrolase [Firmicutes bacterium]|nr:Cytosine deaminase and related metal-dependent hydrolase [Bacillota bacterium]
MNIKFINAKIITMEEPVQVLEGELWVEGDKVSYVGPMKDDKNIKWDREIDAAGNIIMPGFKNAHTHSAMTFLRSFVDDLPLQEWLYERAFPMEAKLTGEYIYHFSKLAIMEYLTSGITANFDMYMQNELNAKASIECGFRTVLCGSINDFGGTLEEIEEEYTRFNHYHPLLSYMIGFHAEYTTKRETLEGMAALGQKYKAPIYTHNSESRNEVAGCIERYGKTPTVFLDSLGMFEYGGGGFHCVHMSEADLAICKEKQLHVVTNPASNLKLASGIAPISKMLDMGINLGIGTDGAASNNCLDMFREMFLVTGLAKYRDMDASSVDAVNVLKMATVGGAKAMGLKECDTIAEGKKADLIMLDMHQPNMQPMNNIIKNIVYAGSKQNVVLTMVAGKILYDFLDGKQKFNVGVEPEEVYTKVNEIMINMKN